MNSAADSLAFTFDKACALMEFYCGDLKPEEFLYRPSADANCAAWIIGHLAVSNCRVLTTLGAADIPRLPDGFKERFGRENNAPKANDFGDVTQLMPLFKEIHRRVVLETAKLSAEAVEKPLEKSHPMFKTVGELIGFMAVHTAMHSGQVTMIRRALGKPPLV